MILAFDIGITLIAIRDLGDRSFLVSPGRPIAMAPPGLRRAPNCLLPSRVELELDPEQLLPRPRSCLKDLSLA